MVIPFVPAAALPVKTGARSNIDFTAQYRPDPCRIARTVKIDHAVHGSMIRDRRAVHAQLLDPGDIFFYFVGPIQKTVFCMGMKMCKIHPCLTCQNGCPIVPGSDPINLSVPDLRLFLLEEMTDGTFKSVLGKSRLLFDDLR